MGISLNYCSLAVSSALLCLAAPVQSQAGGPHDATTWAVESVTGPCAQVPGFEARIAQAIPEHVVAAPSDAEMRIRIQTRTVDGRSEAQVEVYDSILDAPAGSRSLRTQEQGCADLQEQLHLVVSILVEAGRGAPGPPLEEEETQAPPDEPEPPAADEETEASEEDGEPDADTTRFSTRRRVRRLRVGPPRHYELGAVATAGWGVQPGVYAGAELRWSIAAGDRWPIRLAGGFFAPSEASRSDRRARFSAGYASLATCPRWPVRRVMLGACGLVALGATRAEGRGFTSGTTQRAPLALLGLEGFVAIHLAGPAELVVGMQALGVPFRARFSYYTAEGEALLLHQAVPVALHGHAGLQLQLP